jgi:hypothetical protein
MRRLAAVSTVHKKRNTTIVVKPERESLNTLAHCIYQLGSCIATWIWPHCSPRLVSKRAIRLATSRRRGPTVKCRLSDYANLAKSPSRPYRPWGCETMDFTVEDTTTHSEQILLFEGREGVLAQTRPPITARKR